MVIGLHSALLSKRPLALDLLEFLLSLHGLLGTLLGLHVSHNACTCKRTRAAQNSSQKATR